MEKNKCWTLPQKVLELQSRVDDIDIDIPIMKEDISKKVDKFNNQSNYNVVYGVEAHSEDTNMYDIDINANPSTLVMRSTAGTVRTDAPRNNPDCVNLQYANNNYLKKINEGSIVYCNDGNGNPIGYSLGSNSFAAWSIVMRNENGEIITGTPTTDNSAVNKGYINPVLLWTNPNPTTAFAQQTLNLNIAPYKYIVVTFNRFDGYTTPIQKFINKGGNSTVFTMYGARLAVRTFTIGIQQVALGNATYYDLNTTSGVTNNQYLIPLEIYGTNTL